MTSSRQARLSASSSDRLRRSLEAADLVLAFHPVTPVPARCTYKYAIELAEEINEKATRELARLDVNDPRVGPLREFAIGISDFEYELRKEERSSREDDISNVHAIFDRLRHVGTPGDLLKRACVEVVTYTGFSRVMLSRVDDETWTPQLIYHDDAGFTSLKEGTCVPLDRSPVELRLCRTGEPRIVDTDEVAPGSSIGFLTELKFKSYAIAPVAPAGKAVALLHADHHRSRRPTIPVERDMLGILAGDVARIYEWTMLTERLRDRRDRVHDLLRSFEASVNSPTIDGRLYEQHFRGGETPDGAVQDPKSDASIHDSLTHREREILALVVQGHSNRTIAENLVVVEGTIKSHVKHLLRKFGVVNRSELIARALRAGPR